MLLERPLIPRSKDGVLRVIRSVIPGAEVEVQRGPASEEAVGMWAAEW